MDTFVDIIESDTLLPVLVLLLLTLIGVFLWLIATNKKKKKRQIRKYEIDESKEIKIFSPDNRELKEQEEEYEEENISSEIKIIEEVKPDNVIKDKKEEVKIDIPSPKSTNLDLKKEADTLDFPDLSDKVEEIEKDVEDEIIKAANEYIRSIMKK